MFFDQNTIADEGSTRFLNNAFVHNPLLDSGGAVGVDANGFTPGARLADHIDGTAGDWWRASLGVFGAGEGASFHNSFNQPFVIAQLEAGQLYCKGLTGNYRVYAWTNGSATPYADAAAQRAPLRLGAECGPAGDGNGDAVCPLWPCRPRSRALRSGGPAGLELSGAAWGRESDRLGFAGGWLRASKSFELDAPTLDADGLDGPDFGYAASGAEQLAEIYYAWHANAHLALTPDLQWIFRPGADGAAEHATLVGLRATLGF